MTTALLQTATENKPQRRTQPRPAYRRRTTCRGCSGDRLLLALSLGAMPLANGFLGSPDEFAGEPKFPLDVFFCETCSLAQLLDVVDPEIMFRHYLYQTGISTTIAAHNVRLARQLTDMLRLGKRDLVVEAASNDGSLLKCFRDIGTRILGIEPATNLARVSENDGVETVNQFFCSETARQVRDEYGPARVVIGNNVLAHVDDPSDFLQGARILLAADGLAVFEFPYLGAMLERMEYDTIYHEHLSYFSIQSVTHLCETAGLSVVRIEHLTVHGGSLRVFAAPTEGHVTHAPQVMELINKEKASGSVGFERIAYFADGVRRHRDQLLGLLGDLHSEGKTIAGYGAPAKGNTMLNYCGIGRDLLPYLVDKNPLKVGHYAPGSHIPVLDAPVLLQRQPDYTLILAWNFAVEIQRQQQEYRKRGGQFIIPIPEPKIV